MKLRCLDSLLSQLFYKTNRSPIILPKNLKILRNVIGSLIDVFQLD